MTHSPDPDSSVDLRADECVPLDADSPFVHRKGFSSRRLLAAAVLVVASYFTWHWYDTETQAIRRLEEIRAKVTMRGGSWPSTSNSWLSYFGFQASAGQPFAIAVQFEVPHCQTVRLNELPRLPRVHFVRVGGLPFDDVDIQYLAQLPLLRSLEFRKTDISDAGLEHVSKVMTLQTLELSGSRITDSGLACLVGLPDLEVLRLNNTAVTDDCIPHLLRCPKLQLVWLHNTSVSDEGVRQLQARLNVER